MTSMILPMLPRCLVPALCGPSGDCDEEAHIGLLISEFHRTNLLKTRKSQTERIYFDDKGKLTKAGLFSIRKGYDEVIRHYQSPRFRRVLLPARLSCPSRLGSTELSFHWSSLRVFGR